MTTIMPPDHRIHRSGPCLCSTTGSAARPPPATSTRTGPVYDPALGEVSKQVRLASTADVDTAVAAAASGVRRVGPTPRSRAARR